MQPQQPRPVFVAEMIPTGRPGEFGIRVNGPIMNVQACEDFVFGILNAIRQQRAQVLAAPKIQTPTPEQSRLLVG